jgi:hypothetical protein
MAKCIRVVGHGVPVRMSDDDAFQIVERDLDGEYCSKRFFKEWYGPSADFPEKAVREELRARLVTGAITMTKTLARNLQHSRKVW